MSIDSDDNITIINGTNWTVLKNLECVDAVPADLEDSLIVYDNYLVNMEEKHMLSLDFSRQIGDRVFQIHLHFLCFSHYNYI